jgi:uncharacterized protein
MYIFPGYTRYYEENGAIYVVSDVYQSSIKLTDPDFQKEFYSMVQTGGCQSLASPLAVFLHEQGVIANKDEISTVLEQILKLLEDTLMMTILPTESCNFRCPYCYESHAPISMHRETLDSILRYIKDQAPHFKTISLGWFGGEPTLCKDVVVEATGFIQTLSKVEHIRFESSMTTNGFLLDIETFKKFYSVGITSYQITLDGWNHDKTRPLASGKGTLDTIIKNLYDISGLSQDEYQFRIILRHNVLEGDTDYSWYDYLQSLFGGDKRFFMLVHPVGNWGGETVEILNLPKGKDGESLILEHIEYIKRIGLQCENGRTSLFSKICYASYPHSMVFRSDGRIEKCTVAMNHPKNKLGVVDSINGITIDDRINSLWSNNMLKNECYTCKDVLSCFNMHCNRNAIVNGCSNSSCSAELSKSTNK